MSKKVIALLSALILIISSMSLVTFAADEREVIVVYPGFKSSGRTDVSGDGTPGGGGFFMFANLSDTAATSGFPVTDSRIGRRTGTAQTSNTTGYTNYTPGTLEKNMGFIYKPCASDATNSSGWYDVYVERLLYCDLDSTDYAVPDSMHVDVIHKDGIAHYLMDMTPNENYTTKSKYADLVKIGTFYFNDVTSHQVRIFSPVIKELGSKKVRYDFGGVMFVPANESTEKSYYKPVFSDDFSDGIAPVWYEYSEDTRFVLASRTAEIPAGSSLKINYAEGEDAAEAVKFAQGAINFRLWWRNQEKNDAYTSVVLGKSETDSAEFRIYSEKVVYAENNVEICEIPINGYYALHYNPKADGTYYDQYKHTLSGYYDEETSTSYYPHMMRIEISEPEALAENGTKITDNLKTVKVIVNYGSSNAHIMAMGSLPENSILNDEDADLTDNYIEFKNVAGENENNEIDIRDISIMVPDDEITSKSVYATSVNNLKYTKSDDELSIYTGILGAEAVVSKPCEITNTLLKSNSYTGIAVMAPYTSGGSLVDAPVIRNLNLMPGTKKKITMTIDTHTDDMSKVKFFIWDSFDELTPAKEAEDEVIY